MKQYCTLSEAIRAGAAIRPQGFDDLFLKTADGRLGSCALGAGYEAMFGSPCANTQANYDKVDAAFPYLLETFPGCPLGDDCESEIEPTYDLSDLVVHLNDQHEWTRERIADWLEIQEEKLGFVLVVDSETECLSITEREPELAGVST